MVTLVEGWWQIWFVFFTFLYLAFCVFVPFRFLGFLPLRSLCFSIFISITKGVTFLFIFVSFVFLTIFLLRRYVFSCRYLLRSIYGFVHPERFDLCEHAFPFFCDLWLFSSRKVRSFSGCLCVWLFCILVFLLFLYHQKGPTFVGFLRAPDVS